MYFARYPARSGEVPQSEERGTGTCKAAFYPLLVESLQEADLKYPERLEESAKPNGDGGQVSPEADPADDYINAEDLFYWMEDPGDSDVPLCALGIDFPRGCRFCI